MYLLTAIRFTALSCPCYLTEAPRTVTNSSIRQLSMRKERSAMKLIGVDVWRTFTDVVYTDTDTHQVLIHKILTTPADPSVGVITGITDLCQRHGINPADIQQIYHGTTIATNALLEYKGARAGVITTKGYRDILHIGRHQRPQHYSIQQEIPWQDRPLDRRRHSLVVKEW